MKITASLLPLQSSYVNYKTQSMRAKILLDFMSNSKNFPITELDKNSEGSKLRRVGPVGLRIKNLNYKYSEDSNFVLKNINLQINPGEFVALIGPSGSGKSTLADLIIKINEPTEGEIEFFSGSENSISSESFGFGYVAQRPGIISGSIKENIALGLKSEEIDQQILEKSIKDSHLDKLISELQVGFDTDLGKQADSLSGGQLQRIGLARALFSQPNLLVLDEATSALDAETESAVAQSLSELRGKCTMLVIAHRLSTVQNADIVYVLDQGEIVASGKFADLAKSNELVAKYIELSEIRTSGEVQETV
jgi:ATP-binding cassette subfamily C protein